MSGASRISAASVPFPAGHWWVGRNGMVRPSGVAFSCTWRTAMAMPSCFCDGYRGCLSGLDPFASESAPST